MLETFHFLWRDRRLARFLAASLAGRVGFSMLPLGVVLFVHARTGSFAAAGAAVGALTLAGALHPLRGMVVDRLGWRAVVAFAVAFGVAAGAFVAAGLMWRSPAPVIAAAALAGLVAPPLGPFTRAVLGVVLHEQERRLQSSYAIESALEDGTLVIGPLIVGGVVAVASPAIAIVLASIGVVAGAAATAVSPLSRIALGGASASALDHGHQTRPSDTPHLSLAFALSALLGAMVALGALDVTLPAFTRHHGSPAAAGVLLALLAAGSVAGGLWYGAHPKPGSSERHFAALNVVFALALVPAVFLRSIVALGVTMVVAGLPLGPLSIAVYAVVARARPGQSTGAFGWVVTATNAGAAVGASGAGALIASHSPTAGFVVAVAAAAGGALMALAVAIRRVVQTD